MSNEKVTVTFHVIKRVKYENEKVIVEPYEKTHLEKAYDILSSKMGLDFEDKDIQEGLRKKRFCAVKQLEWNSDQTGIKGIFWATYTGHEYRNLDVGTIQAGSVNLRRFYFELYLSDSGSVYIATQYLGNFGGYTQFKETISAAFKEEDFKAKYLAINTVDIDLEKARIGEISVQWAKAGVSAFNDNSVGTRGITTIMGSAGTKNSQNSPSEARLIKKLLHNKRDAVKREVFDMLTEQEILMVDEDEVENVSFLLVQGKKKRRFQLIDARTLATHFQVNVATKRDGHPLYDDMVEAVDHLFNNTILKLSEDV